MLEPISWKEVAKPGMTWLLRRLPGRLFRWFTGYDRRTLEKDIRLTFGATNPLTVTLPKDLRVPYLEFSFNLLNTSPYLDVLITKVSCTLAARYREPAEDIFASYENWDRHELFRRRSELLQCEFWLNEFQLPIVQRFLRGEARIQADVVVWVESKVGFARPFDVFDLSPPNVRQ